MSASTSQETPQNLYTFPSSSFLFFSLNAFFLFLFFSFEQRNPRDPPFNGLVLPLPSQIKALNQSPVLTSALQLPGPGQQGVFSPESATPIRAKRVRGARKRAGQAQQDSSKEAVTLISPPPVDPKEVAPVASPVPVSRPAVNYTALPELKRAPAVGDVLVYKVLELSASYTPEMSDFREATVLAFDPQTTLVRLQLAEHSRQLTQGDWDGVTPRKFELDEVEEGAELLEPEAEHRLRDLNDVRLLTESSKTS